jgi:hypothetical protein
MDQILSDSHPNLRTFIKSVNGEMIDIVGSISFESPIVASDKGITRDALFFDGEFSANFVGRLLPDYGYTISFICNLSEVTQSLTYLFTQGLSGETSGTNYNALRYKSGGFLSVFTETGEGQNNTHDTVDQLFIANVIDHIAITFSSSYFDVFKNGSFLYREPFTPADGTPDFGSIGANGPANSNYFNGVLERIRVFDTVLSNSEILALSTEAKDKTIGGTAPEGSSIRIYNAETGSHVLSVESDGTFNLVARGINDIDVICKYGSESFYVGDVETPVMDLEFISSQADYRAWVRGEVTKLSLPFSAQVAAFTLSNPAKLLGTTTTDPDTGAYEIDVAPYTSEVMVFAAMDYGRVFEPGYNLAADQVIHPTTPNRCVYRAKNAGALGDTEPDWPLVGEITSGAVVLEAHSLYEPLAGGYLKPTIEAK